MTVKELMDILALYDHHADIRFRLNSSSELALNGVSEDNVPANPCGGIIIDFGGLYKGPKDYWATGPLDGEEL